MKRTLAFALLACAGIACTQPSDPLEYVDPFIGTGFHGHTFPGAATPFGMVQLSPDTRSATGMPAPATTTTTGPSTDSRIPT